MTREDELPGRESAGCPDAELRELREAASKVTFVTYRDPDVHRSTLLELLKRSRHRAMCVLDESGALLSSASNYAGRIIGTLGWSDLTQQVVNGSAFIRSSTGGASIFTMLGEARSTLSLVSLPARGGLANFKRKLARMRKAGQGTERGDLLMIDLPGELVPAVSALAQFEEWVALPTKGAD